MAVDPNSVVPEGGAHRARVRMNIVRQGSVAITSGVHSVLLAGAAEHGRRCNAFLGEGISALEKRRNQGIPDVGIIKGIEATEPRLVGNSLCVVRRS